MEYKNLLSKIKRDKSKYYLDNKVITIDDITINDIHKKKYNCEINNENALTRLPNDLYPFIYRERELQRNFRPIIPLYYYYKKRDEPPKILCDKYNRSCSTRNVLDCVYRKFNNDKRRLLMTLFCLERFLSHRNKNIPFEIIEMIGKEVKLEFIRENIRRHHQIEVHKNEIKKLNRRIAELNAQVNDQEDYIRDLQFYINF